MRNACFFRSTAPRRAMARLACCTLLAFTFSGHAAAAPDPAQAADITNVPDGPNVPAATSVAPAAPTASDAHYQGRFSVQYEDRIGQSRNVYGNFRLDQAKARNPDIGTEITLSLTSPFGQTLAQISWFSNAEATLTLPNRPVIAADDVSTLMQDTLGFALPLEGLNDWIHASGTPGSQAIVKTDPQNPAHITQIIQDGWTIDYIPYADASASASAPSVRRMNLTRTDPPLVVRLVLDQ